MWFRFAPLVLLAALSPGQVPPVRVGSVPLLPAQPNPNVKRYTVTGTVINTITGEPIRRALVNLNGPEHQVALTGADGRFEFQNIPEGGVWIQAQRPGFFVPNRPNKPFVVGSGSNDFRVPLTPESKITGRVVDSDGDPVEGIQVQVLGPQIMEGRRQWMMRGAANTDENGAFTIDGQMPGPVLVCTAARPLMYGPNVMETYPARCYPNATDAASAQPIDIAPGQIADVNFTVDAVRGYRVTGVVSGGNGRIAGFITSTDGLTPMMGIEVNWRTGRFVTTGLPSGTWQLHFQTMEQPGEAPHTVEEVSVNGADVNGLQVTLAAGVNIPIEYVQSATANAESSGPVTGIIAGNAGTSVVRLSRPGANMFTAEVPMAQPDPNNASGQPPRQIIKNVSPGTYKVSVQPTGGCIGSVTSGGLDLLRQPLTITPGAAPEPIVVTMRNDCGSLEVALHSDHPENETTLLLVPEIPGLEARIMGVSGQTSFTFSDLTPGVYRVYAISGLDSNQLEYANPDAMRDLGGATVAIDANQKATTNLNVVERK